MIAIIAALIGPSLPAAKVREAAAGQTPEQPQANGAGDPITFESSNGYLPTRMSEY